MNQNKTKILQIKWHKNKKKMNLGAFPLKNDTRFFSDFWLTNCPLVCAGGEFAGGALDADSGDRTAERTTQSGWQPRGPEVRGSHSAETWKNPMCGQVSKWASKTDETELHIMVMMVSFLGARICVHWHCLGDKTRNRFDRRKGTIFLVAPSVYPSDIRTKKREIDKCSAHGIFCNPLDTKHTPLCHHCALCTPEGVGSNFLAQFLLSVFIPFWQGVCGLFWSFWWMDNRKKSTCDAIGHVLVFNFHVTIFSLFQLSIKDWPEDFKRYRVRACSCSSHPGTAFLFSHP